MSSRSTPFGVWCRFQMVVVLVVQVLMVVVMEGGLPRGKSLSFLIYTL